MTKTSLNTASEITIPVSLKLLLRAGREYRPLRLYVIQYCTEHEIPGFEPYKPAAISFHHNELFDENGNLKPVEPENLETPKTNNQKKG